MLNHEATKLLNPKKQNMSLRVENNMIILQFEDSWVMLSRQQAIDLIQSLANAANSMI